MKNHHISISIIVSLAVVLAFGLTALLLYPDFIKEKQRLNSQPAGITSYDECVAAGYPIMESYPEQCATRTQTFTRPLTAQELIKSQIQLETPKPHDEVVSGFEIAGYARGTWFFEGSFSAEVINEQDEVMGMAILQAKGDWMTENYVEFQGTMNFSISEPVAAKLVLKKANPSGLPENDQSLILPLMLVPKS